MDFAIAASILALSLAYATTVDESKPEGYLAEPNSGKGRGVLVLHPWWG